MIYLISIMPGLGFTSFLFLFIIGLFQSQLYKKTGCDCSRDLSLFFYFASIYALAPFIAHSRGFSAEFCHVYVLFAAFCLCVSSIFYLKSISYFITVPKWIYNGVFRADVLVSAIAFLAIPSYFFFSYNVYFDPGNLVETDNFFVNSYTARIGATLLPGMSILSFSGLISSVFAFYLLRVVLKSSKDAFFILGLLMTIFSSILENALLPFTLKFFFPIVFLSNLFEAFRMNHLINIEYRREKVLAEVGKEQIDTETVKYQNSSLNEDRLSQLAVKITSVLEKDKIFLNPNLKAEQLARAIGIPSYQLSQVINIGLNTSFFDLLSLYRIEEVKRRLSDPSFAKETIINIAYDCGFNSKSSFNTAFKKYTKMTPSAYRSEIMGEEAFLDS